MLEESWVTVKLCSMGAVHFVPRDTGHPLAEGFGPKAFKWWYAESLDRITPILDATFQSDGMIPILLSGNTDESGKWGKAFAAAEQKLGNGSIRICQVKLHDHTQKNPAAGIFAYRLLG